MLEGIMQNLAGLLEEGVVVLLTGMGVVFCFLAIMVVAMFIMSAIVAKLNQLFPAKVVALPQAKKSQAVSIGEDIAIAIAAVLNKR